MSPFQPHVSLIAANPSAASAPRKDAEDKFVNAVCDGNEIHIDVRPTRPVRPAVRAVRTRAVSSSSFAPLSCAQAEDHLQAKFPLPGRLAAAACRDTMPGLPSQILDKRQDCHMDLHRRKKGAECELCHNIIRAP
jgi:hypothetical protein